MTIRAPLSNPGVRFPPPLIFIAGLGAGWVLDRYVLALPLTRIGNVPVSALGWWLVAVGVAIGAWGMVTFRRARTAILPHHRASSLVVAGPYRFTRNPMYTGMTFAYVGTTTLLGIAWPLILLPVVLLVMYRFVIRREERYLEDAFGGEYVTYRSRVRRWL